MSRVYRATRHLGLLTQEPLVVPSTRRSTLGDHAFVADHHSFIVADYIPTNSTLPYYGRPMLPME